jgi:hypothetical protein
LRNDLGDYTSKALLWEDGPPSKYREEKVAQFKKSAAEAEAVLNIIMEACAIDGKAEGD